MNGWLLDTNVISSLINPNGAPSVKRWAAAQDERHLYLSIITLAEYDKGISNLPDSHADRPRFIAARDALAFRFSDRVLLLSNTIVRRWGTISGTIKRDRGHPPPVIDTLLAATAIEHDLYFVSRNVRDIAFAGALIFNPWDDNPALFPLS